MKVVFLGMTEKKTGGCACRRKNRVQRVTVRAFYLPSGRTKTFRAGRIEEVSDTDGAYLLSQTYTSPTGEEQRAFMVA